MTAPYITKFVPSVDIVMATHDLITRFTHPMLKFKFI